MDNETAQTADMSGIFKETASDTKYSYPQDIRFELIFTKCKHRLTAQKITFANIIIAYTPLGITLTTPNCLNKHNVKLNTGSYIDLTHNNEVNLRY